MRASLPLLLSLVSLVLGPAATTAAQSVCSTPSLAFGRSVVWPAEIESGLQLGRGSPTPSLLSFRVYPTWVVNRTKQIRLAALVGPAWVNPGADLLLGGRASAEIVPFGPFGIGLFGALEGSYGTSGRSLFSVALIGDLGNIAQVTGRVTRLGSGHVTFISFGLGTNLENVFGGPARAAPAAAAHTPVTFGDDYLGRVSAIARNAMSSVINAASDSDSQAKDRNDEKRARGDLSAAERTDHCTTVVDLAPKLVQLIAAHDSTVALLRSRLQASVFARADTVMGNHPEFTTIPAGVAESAIVEAVVQGFRAALDQ